MGCEPFPRGRYSAVRGIICSRGPAPKPKICVGCGQKRALLACDAHVPEPASDTCDAPICAHCTARVDGFDVDLCPAHANQPTPPGECTVEMSYRERRIRDANEPVSPRQGCEGAIIYPSDLCLRHARLFDRWLGRHRGWEDFYSKSDAEVPRAKKRAAFRAWLDEEPAEARA